ncbi:F-box/WD-40 repeat-containing protein At3g52030 isoform X2 [Cornus florida]|uniref:F-box/WD-40 repeat-containing protein At3g52030 isoform X2 n=1 Tax=Cornus florida TaxID=4283 RepID=UPI00289CDDF7|nr:F-box/WD-40 repeat-containing protein At3g52030 isoform X2 [Cornus florida]
MNTTTSGGVPPSKRRKGIHALSHDTLCTIFTLLDLIEAVRCTTVCRYWRTVINKYKLLQVLYSKQERRNSADLFDASMCSERSLKIHLEEVAMDWHRFSLRVRPIDIYQWKGHSVMRLWSAERYKCLDEYSLPDNTRLVDFDFDENKVVGLVGTRICIWRRHNAERNIFPSRENLFTNGLCMRYVDPEAVVGCEDGTARVFDMYSRKCSQIIKMHLGPVTCLSLSDDQLIISGSSTGGITVSGLSTGQRVAALMSSDSSGIRTLCFNPSSHLLFAGSTSGYASCWDLRTMKKLWETRVSPNVLYSMHHLQIDRSTLVTGGIDGVLRVLDQNTGEVYSRCIMYESNRGSNRTEDVYGVIKSNQAVRLAEDDRIDLIPRTSRPPIRCLAVGMRKVVTTHNDKCIRLWKFKA